jgi:hypothetical protein
MITGECLCGALRYEVAGTLQGPVSCHCSMCRKHHGAPFATVFIAPVHALRWLSGEASVCEYRSSAGRVRRSCGSCGSVAPTPLDGERVLLPAGNLLGELSASGGVHAYVGSKALWHVIADGLPQYDGAVPGWPTPEVVHTSEAVGPEGATHGSCLCGAVAFTVNGPPMRWLQCHCSRCRRGRSAVHGSNTFYAATQFAWRSGRELARKYKVPEAERFAVAFCVRCGGGTPVERENIPFVLVPAGLLDGDPGARPQGHIFVASKAPWFTITDALPQFEALPPA